MVVDAPVFVQRKFARNKMSSPHGPSFAEKLQLRREERKRRDMTPNARPSTFGGGKETVLEEEVAESTAGKASENPQLSEFSDQFLNAFAPKSYSIAQQRALSPTVVAFNRHDSFSPVRRSRSRSRGSGSSRSPSRSQSRSPSRSRSRSPFRGFSPDVDAIRNLEQESKEHKKNVATGEEARRRLQQRQAQRLHNPGSENADTKDGKTTMTTSADQYIRAKTA